MTNSEARVFLKLLVTKYISNEEIRNDMVHDLEKSLSDVPVKGVLAVLQKNYQGAYTDEELNKLRELCHYFI